MAGYPPYYHPPGGGSPPRPAVYPVDPNSYGGVPPSRPHGYYTYGGAPAAPPSAPPAYSYVSAASPSYSYTSAPPPPGPYDSLSLDIREIFRAVALLIREIFRSGQIDDRELQMALSGHRSFSMRTVHLLMRLFTGNSSFKIGPNEFVSLYHSLQNWRKIFEKFDRDRSGHIDAFELQEALKSLDLPVSPAVLDILVSKLSDPRTKALDYDKFIDCCLIIKGLKENFNQKDTRSSGSATFTHEEFMCAVLPFLII